MQISIDVSDTYQCQGCGEIHTTETKAQKCCGEGSKDVFADEYGNVYIQEQNGVWHSDLQ